MIDEAPMSPHGFFDRDVCREAFCDGLATRVRQGQPLVLRGEPGVGCHWVKAQVEARLSPDERAVSSIRVDWPGSLADVSTGPSENSGRNDRGVQVSASAAEHTVLVAPLADEAIDALMAAVAPASFGSSSTHALSPDVRRQLVTMANGLPFLANHLARRAAHLGPLALGLDPTAWLTEASEAWVGAFPVDVRRALRWLAWTGPIRSEDLTYLGPVVARHLPLLQSWGAVRTVESYWIVGDCLGQGLRQGHMPKELRRKLAAAGRSRWLSAQWEGRTPPPSALDFAPWAQGIACMMLPDLADGHALAFLQGDAAQRGPAPTHLALGRDLVARLTEPEPRCAAALFVAVVARRLGDGAAADDALLLIEEQGALHQRARAALLRGELAFGRGEFEAAEAALAKATEHCEVAGDEEGIRYGQMVRAWVDRACERMDSARATSELALRQAEANGCDLRAMHARLNLALVALTLGEPSRALAHLAADAFSERSAHGWEARRRVAIMASFRCVAHELLQDHQAAQHAIDLALASQEAPSMDASLWRGYRGRVALAAGRWEEAVQHLLHASQGMEALGANPSVSTFAALLAVAYGCQGEDSIAEEAMALARRTQGKGADRQAITQAASEALAYERISRPVPGEPAARPPRWKPSMALVSGEPASLHLRAVASALNAVAGAWKRRAARHESLHYDEGAGFSYRGLRQSLVPGGVAARLLKVLIRQETQRVDAGATGAEHPFGFLDDAALIETIWPGERLTGQSGANRLRVAIAELRRLGLRECIERVDATYRLRPDLVIRDEAS